MIGQVEQICQAVFENRSNAMDILKVLVEVLPMPVFFKDINGVYTGCNTEFEKFTNRDRNDIIGKTVYDVGPEKIASKYDAMDRELFDNPGRQSYEWKVVTATGEEKSVIFNKSTFNDGNGNTAGLLGIITDITENKKKEAQRETLISNLEDAIKHIKQLSGLLPICSSCKKIRDDKGYWKQIENYIEDHSEALFSHSICPDCSNELYWKEDWFKKSR